MAAWQTFFHIIPRKNINDLFDDGAFSWKDTSIGFEKIDFLERRKSWSKDIIQYGSIDGTCIEFSCSNNGIEEISCRFDLRNFVRSEFENIVDYVNKINGMFWIDGEIYYPEYATIFKVITNSPAGKFCKDPISYLESISLLKKDI